MSDVQAHLESVIAALDRHHQRATYGAVGGVVGLPARSLMFGRPKCAPNSWVVSAKKRLPSGYEETDQHMDLFERKHVIGSANEPAAWLAKHS
jgi:hypothetical protein